MTALRTPMTPQQEDMFDLFMKAVWDERVRAHIKHGDNSMEQADTIGDGAYKRASILMEEAAECGTALNDHATKKFMLYGVCSKDHARSDELDTELIQTTAMAYTWWANRRGDKLTPAVPEPEPGIGQLVSYINSLVVHGNPDLTAAEAVDEVRRIFAPPPVPGLERSPDRKQQLVDDAMHHQAMFNHSVVLINQHAWNCEDCKERGRI